MRRLGIRLALCLVVFSFGATTAARAAIAINDLQSFEKGKTTEVDVVAAYGPPTKTETNDEGLKAIAYTDDPAQLRDGAIFAFFGAVNGMFMPGIGAVEAVTNGPMTAFVFDRAGLLMYYRAEPAGSAPITSEDGAGPMPNVKVNLRRDQLQSNLPDDGKPHVGLQLVPTSELDADHKAEFVMARFAGLVVANVIPASAAAKAGLERGDYLYVLNGQLVTSFADLGKAMASVKMGDSIVLRVKRIDEASHRAREAAFTLRF
ncbi:MAG TPA: PDZ domain-containing protein [Magnetospirillaceae bacterium]|jgi:hypothetical protein